jgi:hypothetical protein
MGNGAGLQISHLGASTICTKEKLLHLNNILCVPSINKNLMSISQLTKDNNMIVKFTSSSCFMKDPLNHMILLHGTLHDVCTSFMSLPIHIKFCIPLMSQHPYGIIDWCIALQLLCLLFLLKITLL